MEFTTVEANGVALSVRIFRPNAGVEPKSLTLILVHQYSVLGGCQGLLKGMANRLAAKGFTTITFDMRGAGRSSGRPSITGSAEVQDVIAVCKWAVDKLPAPSILLIGSSAGAPIAGSAIDQVKEVVGYVSLGYPFGILASVLFGRHNKACLQSEKPKLFVMGMSDGFTSVKQLENKLKTAAGRIETKLVPGVGHFQLEGPDYDNLMIDFVTEFADSIVQNQPEASSSSDLYSSAD
ncbi:hypothetical protein CY35_02G202600 [Sphagnum magellanicum]|nr:hypothetical protein CY35_02G202600 [Sphagnum magellanicum]